MIWFIERRVKQCICYMGLDIGVICGCVLVVGRCLGVWSFYISTFRIWKLHWKLILIGSWIQHDKGKFSIRSKKLTYPWKKKVLSLALSLLSLFSSLYFYKRKKYQRVSIQSKIRVSEKDPQTYNHVIACQHKYVGWSWKVRVLESNTASSDISKTMGNFGYVFRNLREVLWYFPSTLYWPMIYLQLSSELHVLFEERLILIPRPVNWNQVKLELMKFGNCGRAWLVRSIRIS